ncbi:organomercurial lyase [Sporichthya polymorpha]|uniref:organomercurial lyase n=1 Tax=Sporichthya polymorpha TaxID=35751 RepID=UPI00037741FF|nr:organomercurial lyase [Sporichthya polymorpha]
MKRSVLFESEAAAELTDAAHWYDDQHPVLGSAFLAAVEAAVLGIDLWPDAAPLVSGLPGDLPVRQAAVRRFPYRVAYLVVDDVIRVLAVAHTRRKPRYWTDRTGAVSAAPPLSALITVLSVPDCPNASLLVARLREAGPGRTPAIDVVVVEDEAEAWAWGMCGSPTLLVDGIDPFAGDGAQPSLSCRLYPGADGRMWGAPSVEELRAVIAPRPAEPTGTTSLLDPVVRGGQGRLAPTDAGMRAVQQAVLRSLASSGTLPNDRALDAAAGPGRSGRAVLAALAEQDFVSIDDGGVRAAYPFSLRQTRHQVAIEGGPTVWAMCAIDALGVGPMLGRATAITSSDPVSGQTIIITATPNAATEWEPAGTVVLVGRRAEKGPASAVCCDVINFFASAHTAARWAALHLEAPGAVLGRADAMEISRATFGHLLEAEPAPG